MQHPFGSARGSLAGTPQLALLCCTASLMTRRNKDQGLSLSPNMVIA